MAWLEDGQCWGPSNARGRPWLREYTVQGEDRFAQRAVTQSGQGCDGGAQKGCPSVGGVMKEGFMEERRAEQCSGG